MKRKVEIINKEIKIDGQTVQIISGAIHYFRIHPGQWRDRLQKAVQMGLNCVETYFCWNLHEPVPGKFDFFGIIDFEIFIKTAQELGLYVIVRPGPYICAEWDNGGIPPWLMSVPGCRLRRSNAPYLAAVKRWFDALLPKLRRLQYTNGGPVIMAAVENEYGSFGRDSEYVKSLYEMYLEHGLDVPLITADGGGDNSFVLGGSIDECPVTLTFDCGDVMKYFVGKREIRPDGPDFCMEYWLGMFDHWGAPHRTIDKNNAAKKLDMMLSSGASVNLYMFHGGTNFGFNNGANMMAEPFIEYAADTTSYDYDAPLSECGDPTEKYFAIQQVIKKHRTDAAYGTPSPCRKKAYGKVALLESASLLGHLDKLSSAHYTADTEPMEFFGQNQGFIFYQTELRGPMEQPEKLKIYGLHDRAQIWLDDQYLGSAFRNDKDISFPITIKKSTAILKILVENMGHINYGPYFGKDLKGIIDGVTIRYQYQNNYKCYPLPLEDLTELTFSPTMNIVKNKPMFYRSYLEVDEPANTFLRFPGEKGVVWINGFNLGRYWNIGPGDTLYVPEPILKPGLNEIIVLELHKLNSLQIEFIDRPSLNEGVNFTYEN